MTHYCPAIEPPAGGYLHCSSRPNQDSAYKPGTTCRLRCRKGYVFQRHKASGPSNWQNQVIDTPSSGDDNNLGLAILQGWKATQIWRGLDWNLPVVSTPSPARPNVTVIDSFDAQIRRPTTVTTATDAKKKLKGNAPCPLSVSLIALCSDTFLNQKSPRARPSPKRSARPE